MAIQTIQYQNKVALNTNPEIADINKVTDNDMNEIKSVVNNNANLLHNLRGSGIYNNVDYNDFTDTGIYYMGENNTNSPSAYCYLLVMSSYGSDLVQFAIYVTNLTIYVRSRATVQGVVSWSAWKSLTPQ